ncbi:MAG: glycosyltransferase family 2 protein [Candidatus Omnitrophica bacterium]|nr:glycosyltransferase family 2 protein [Candidatus Omnitrophota bacterium]
MRCPTLKDLPLPPEGKTGWPWTQESPQLPDAMPNGQRWPQISIVTPSYNQGRFIEETIRSALLQGYPDLEYIIMDGGSTDGSVEIIRKYEKWLRCWVSEPDNGQAHAINKGLTKVSGQIFSWLNSDDTYLPGVFKAVAEEFTLSRDTHIVFGDCNLVDENGKLTGIWKGHFSKRKDLIRWWSCVRPDGPCWIMHAIFYSMHAVKEVGPLDETLWWALDYDLWIRLSSRYCFHYLDKVLATYRFHAASKSIQNDAKRWSAECKRVSQKYWGKKFTPSYYYYGYSFKKMQWQRDSTLFYCRAEEQYKLGNRRAALKYISLSLLFLRLNAPWKNHLSIFFRLLIGDTVFNAIRKILFSTGKK